MVSTAFQMIVYSILKSHSHTLPPLARSLSLSSITALDYCIWWADTSTLCWTTKPRQSIFQRTINEKAFPFWVSEQRQATENERMKCWGTTPTHTHKTLLISITYNLLFKLISIAKLQHFSSAQHTVHSPPACRAVELKLWLQTFGNAIEALAHTRTAKRTHTPASQMCLCTCKNNYVKSNTVLRQADSGADIWASRNFNLNAPYMIPIVLSIHLSKNFFLSKDSLWPNVLIGWSSSSSSGSPTKPIHAALSAQCTCNHFSLCTCLIPLENKNYFHTNQFRSLIEGNSFDAPSRTRSSARPAN